MTTENKERHLTSSITQYFEFDFTPPETKNYHPGSIQIQINGHWVEGNASAWIKGNKITVGIYVWSGDVAEATRLTLESIIGKKLKWTEYGGGNGHEGGTLEVIE